MYKIEPLDEDDKLADIKNKINEIITFINGTPQLRVIDEEKLIDIKKAAQILNVNPETLRRWDNAGKLRAIRQGTRKDRKYKLTEIVATLDKQIEEQNG